jgi:beta-mannosidase
MLSELARRDAHRPTLTGAAWRCCAQPAGSVAHPDQLNDDADWLPAKAPGTVASALRSAGRWSFAPPIDIDASDWWFLAPFSLPSSALDEPCRLCFDGLATLAEAWLNGESILTSDNMFRSYQVDVTGRLRADNELAIVFRSVAHDLKRKRPRPRWKTNLVQQQQLRWLRTSLQGRIPGWSPPVPTIGPWRAVRLETGDVQWLNRHVLTELDGTTGVVRCAVEVASSTPLQSAELRVGGRSASLDVVNNGDRSLLSGELRIDHAPLWRPHTHGEPQLLPCEIAVSTMDGEAHRLPCPDVGFRKLEVDASGGAFEIRVNGEPVFCRGACWTTSDVFTLTGTDVELERDLRLARDAGANMLRVGGTMTYESDAFYALCDRLGILVWQDFMFANMDYPVHDASFRANVEAEAAEQLRRFSAHPCVAIYCGNSEVEQQAAMLGLPRDVWRNDFFAETLPSLCAELHPGTAYVPSTPTGGALPFQTRQGVSHYYGVGAYLRGIEDVRRADVKFTPECLGFSNIPEPAAIEAITGGAFPVTHAPQWKARVPRDTGAGWDFEDVRDHYVKELFGVDPVMLRSRDMLRYLRLGRIATGRMMERVFSEWRSVHSRAGGALVWFYKDLWPAAGWGIVDASGFPKSAYFALKRVWRRRQVTITDEGLNGLDLHLTNETDAECAGFVEVLLLREPNTVIAREEAPIRLPPYSRTRLGADDILGRFYDVSYAYRFGPRPHDVAVATWLDESREVVSEAVHVVEPREPMVIRDAAVEASAHPFTDGSYEVRLSSDAFLHAVHLHAPGFLPDDNDFFLVPQRAKIVRFMPWSESDASFHAEWDALNIEGAGGIPVHAPRGA